MPALPRRAIFIAKLCNKDCRGVGEKHKRLLHLHTLSLKNSGDFWNIRTLLTLAPDPLLWYNYSMSNQIDVYTPPPPPVQEAKRIIADAIRRQGNQEIFATPINKNISQKDYLAVMLWDLVTEGKAYYMDGTVLVLEDYDDWLATVKYLSSHIDGGASGDINVGVNVFKVYAGINVDDV